jgi:tetratricopeptide (TPR) repeat protein
MAPWGCDGGGGSAEAGPDEAKVASAGDGTVSGTEVQASLVAAEEYLAGGDLQKAEAILVVLLDRAPDDPRGHELYGRLLAQRAMEAQQQGTPETQVQELFAESYAQYRAAVELGPSSAGLSQSAGEIAHAAGLIDEALRHYLEAGRLRPLDPKPPLWAAQVLLARGEHDAADQQIRRVLQLDPDLAYAHATLAMIELDRSQYDRALSHIDQARRIEPSNLGFRAQAARIQRRHGAPRRGLELLLPLDPARRGSEFVTYEIAQCHAALGEHERAARAWELCFEANMQPQRRWVAAVGAGHAWLDAGQPDSAVMWLERAQLLAPDAQRVRALEEAVRGDR